MILQIKWQKISKISKKFKYNLDELSNELYIVTDQ